MNLKLLIKKDISKEVWTDLINLFDDAAFYQTWSYGVMRWGANNLEYAILSEDNTPLAASQIVIKKIPLLNAGIAYIKWGPMWHRKNEKEEFSIFSSFLKALYHEYVLKRGLLLRIMPNLPTQLNANENIEQLFYEEDYQKYKNAQNYRTFYVNLDYSLDELRKSLKYAWRNQLYRAEEQPVSIYFGTELVLYDQFCQIYREMMNRKGFKDEVNLKAYRRIQEDLSASQKLRIMLCKVDEKLMYANIVATVGNTAIGLLAATSNAGVKSSCSFLAQWKMIKWLKGHGFKWYDLGGVDPKQNPDGYQFKAGLAGKLGTEVLFNGQFEACKNNLSFALVRRVDYFKNIKSKFQNYITTPKHNKQQQPQHI